MTRRETSFVNMITAVVNVLNKYETVWAGFTRFVTSVTNLKSLKQDVDKRAADSQIVTTGSTIDKGNAANEAFDEASKLSKRASIYAIDQNNMELHDTIRVSRGSLSQMSAKSALSKLTAIYNQLAALGDALVPYGITAEDIAGLKQLIDAYDGLGEQPRSLIVERSMHLQTLPQLIGGLRKVLYELDSLITLFADSDFEAEYRNARKIVDPRSPSAKPETPTE